MLAFPNAYFSSDNPKGYMAYMPEIHNEIIGMMEPEKATNTSADEIKLIDRKSNATDAVCFGF